MLNSVGSSRAPAHGVVSLVSQQKAFLYVLLAGMRLAGRVAHMGERRGVYRVLVGKPEGKRPLGRPRYR